MATNFPQGHRHRLTIFVPGNTRRKTNFLLVQFLNDVHANYTTDLPLFIAWKLMLFWRDHV